MSRFNADEELTAPVDWSLEPAPLYRAKIGPLLARLRACPVGRDYPLDPVERALVLAAFDRALVLDPSIAAVHHREPAAQPSVDHLMDEIEYGGPAEAMVSPSGPELSAVLREELARMAVFDEWREAHRAIIEGRGSAAAVRRFTNADRAVRELRQQETTMPNTSIGSTMFYVDLVNEKGEAVVVRAEQESREAPVTLVVERDKADKQTMTLTPMEAQVAGAVLRRVVDPS